MSLYSANEISICMMSSAAGPSSPSRRASRDHSPIDGYFQPGVLFNQRFSPHEESPGPSQAQGLDVPALLRVDDKTPAPVPAPAALPSSETPRYPHLLNRGPGLSDLKMIAFRGHRGPRHAMRDLGFPPLTVVETAPGALPYGFSRLPPATMAEPDPEPEPEPQPSPTPQGPQKPKQSGRKRPELTVNTTGNSPVSAMATPPLFTGTTAATQSTSLSTPRTQDPNPSNHAGEKDWRSLVLQLPAQSEVELHYKRRYWICEAEYRWAADALAYWTTRAEEGRSALKRGENAELLDLTEYQVAYQRAMDAFMGAESELLKAAMQRLWSDSGIRERVKLEQAQSEMKGELEGKLKREREGKSEKGVDGQGSGRGSGRGSGSGEDFLVGLDDVQVGECHKGRLGIVAVEKDNGKRTEEQMGNFKEEQEEETMLDSDGLMGADEGMGKELAGEEMKGGGNQIDTEENKIEERSSQGNHQTPTQPGPAQLKPQSSLRRRIRDSINNPFRSQRRYSEIEESRGKTDTEAVGKTGSLRLL